MCGIVGVIDTKKGTTKEVVAKMSACMAHRGPDDSGLYQNASETVTLAQQRLSLIDLSPAGHQPMTIGSHTIVYNGEIYNYQDIRQELSALGVTCTGDSDTEVLLRAWQQWGSAALAKCRGMFAFAIWDEDTEQLTLCRDRVGVKPLYLYRTEGVLMFASELKAILAHPHVVRTLDHDALQLYLQLGYVPAPYSIFKGIEKVLPAHISTIDHKLTVMSTCYWQTHTTERTDLDEATALTELDTIITESSRLRMIADVPVGVFLSGGIDSSLVTAVLKAQGYDNLSTFTIGFAEATHNESTYAKAVAEHLGTDHHELICTTKDAQAIIPKLPTMFDEPFADASAIPTYLLAQFSKHYVTAALSADGGDELFGGYTRYRSVANIVQQMKRLPPGIGWCVRAFVFVSQLLTRVRIVPVRYTAKFARLHLYYQHRHNLAACYAAVHSCFTNRELSQLLANPRRTFLATLYERLQPTAPQHTVRALQWFDFHTYLPDDILVKSDRATMAASLEGREPLLDHTIIEFAAQVPDGLMHKELGTKYLLRQLLYRYIPRALVDRPKQGFGVPLNEWLRGDLEHLIDTHLSKAALESHGLFQYSEVERMVRAFQSGQDSYQKIWHLIIFQMWYNTYIK